jgi:hypothetical protein
MKIRIMIKDLYQSICLMDYLGLDSQIAIEGYDDYDYYEIDTSGKQHIVEAVHHLMVKQYNLLNETNDLEDV